MKRILLGGFALLVLVALVLGWEAARFLDAPVGVTEQGEILEIRPGTPFAAVSRELGDRGIIERPDVFRWYARLTGKASRVHAGEYRIPAGMSPRQLLDSLVAGNVLLHSFTIVEGWTFRELLKFLLSHPAVEPTLSYEDWPQLLASLGSDAKHPEGLFLPETYRFPRHTPDREILGQAYRLMQEALSAAWSTRDEGLPLESAYEALILASIVEKETARPDERAKIAGVFVRRLQKGMRLQTDPTVIYGIGVDFDGNLTRRDLATDSPYNTYTRGGLPPTPIALPGRAALEAATHPEPGDTLYFVATGLGDGSHKFSVTKEEHDAAVRDYLARLRQSREGRK